MERNTIIGFVLIGLILMIWMWMSAPPPQKPPTHADSLAAVQQKPQTDTSRVRIQTPEENPVQRDSLGKYFSKFSAGRPGTVILETPLYHAEIVTQGGAIRNWTLKEYKTWDHHPVNLIDGENTREFNIIFTSSDGKLINTKSLYFQCERAGGQSIVLSASDSAKVDFVLQVADGSRLIKSLTFYGDRYSFDAGFRFEGMENVLANYEYQIVWESGLRYAEYNSVNESNFAKATAFAGGEVTEVDATSFTEVPKQNISGRVAWVAERNKYFAVAMIPRDVESQGAYLEGSREKLPDNGAKETYNIALKMPFQGRPVEDSRVTVYLGPLEFDLIKQYNVQLDRIMSLGAAWIIRPISEYVIIPLFKFLRLIFINYGVVLIVFSIIIKVVLYPLTKTSMVSMRKMQALQPMMNEIREKHKDDPQKMNQQVMRLYKEYGVNPAGGCLPMLLQLPILYALWAVFSSTIELRQAAFVGWIHDLSVPDVVMKLPFRLPLVGMDELSGLALLMGVTMFVQQKMAVKDPRQKAMVWMMPVLFTIMFNGFPSGLNLYYFMFNLLSIGQQAWFNRQHKDEPLRKVEESKKKGGIISRLSANIPKPPKR